MLLNAAAHPCASRLLILRPERNRVIAELIIAVQCFNVGSPLGSQVKVISLVFVFEEESLVPEQARDHV